MALALGSSAASKIYLGATEIALAYLGTTQVYSAGGAFSAEAQNYFDRLDTAGDTTYVDYKQPLANYIDSLVALGGAYWDTMESAASFVGVGIQGITVPLRDGMPVITENNFVAGDLNQLTGLKGDASTKYLSTGVLDNDVGQNDYSMSSWVTDPVYLDNAYWMGSARIAHRSSSTSSVVKFSTNNNSSSQINVTPDTADNFIGQVRTVGTEYDWFINTNSGNFVKASLAPTGLGISVFAYSAGTSPNASRIATYHYGPALDLATLQGLQATLLAEIAGVGFSTEAADYFGRLLNAGDKTFLAYRQPLANYIDSLVTLGGAYWDTMESAASFVGVGIQGVTVPLKSTMSTLTNNNFVAGDLDQLTGLKGNTSSKYLNTNVADTAVTNVNSSASVHITEKGTGNFDCLLGSQETGAGFKFITLSTTLVGLNIGDAGGFNVTYPNSGMLGGSRVSTNSISYISDGTETSGTTPAGTLQGGNLFVFATNNGSAIRHADARLATYHFGPALDLATLEGLQATLITEIAAI